MHPPRTLRTALAAALRSGAVVAVALLGATGAAAAPDWGELGEVRVPQIFTLTEEGSLRVTKLWLVVVDGQGFVRTGDTRWFRDIERNPDVSIGAQGESHPLRATPVTEPELRARVNAAFRAKYGWKDRLVHPLGAGGSNILRLDPRP
jgi:subtilisin family serine protease